MHTVVFSPDTSEHPLLSIFSPDDFTFLIVVYWVEHAYANGCFE